MNSAVQFDGEHRSNAVRAALANEQPKAMRTFTPSQAVLARSAGCYHWTPEGRKLYDFTSGVLVANLGHNPRRWFQRVSGYMGWQPGDLFSTAQAARAAERTGSLPVEETEYFGAVTLTAYNAVTEIEMLASRRLLASLRSTDYGRHLEMVSWAASGSEGVQKALWACLDRDPERPMILATRHGFHGKKGLANAVTGTENDPERDPRVRFLSFPRQEIDDVSRYGETLNLEPYRNELASLWQEFGSRLGCLITEPYLGGGGSYHPPAEYLQLLERFCREHDLLFVLDEVQANFGRTGRMYAFEKYGIAPDFVCLGKGLGNGVPVAAVAGRASILSPMKYGALSDTWSAAPLACASVVATLDEFETTNVLEHAEQISQQILDGLVRLKETGLITKVRGEGMVFGIECGSATTAAGHHLTPEQVAVALVEACYRGEAAEPVVGEREPGSQHAGSQSAGMGIHLLGPLAGKVLRVSPPLTITKAETHAALELLQRIVQSLADRIAASPAASPTTSASSMTSAGTVTSASAVV